MSHRGGRSVNEAGACVADAAGNHVRRSERVEERTTVGGLGAAASKRAVAAAPGVARGRSRGALRRWERGLREQRA